MESSVYSREEVKEATLEYFEGDELAADVWINKYALRDKEGKLIEKTPTDMHHRLAKEFARIEAKYPNPMSEEEIFKLLKGFKKIVPQGSPMSAIGNDNYVQSLSNCFTIAPPEDSYGGICFTDQEMAQLMKRRGGVGFDISKLRPKGMVVRNAAKTTDGIGCFMERFSNTTREVAQNGRRGALMLTVDIRHPEIETFINIKRDLKKVTGANISIRISDEFMNAVEEDREFELYWPVDAKTEEDKKFVRVVKAKDVWEQIIDSAHAMAEPGLLFWDTIIKNSPADSYASVGYESTSVNPCSEIVLSNYDSCRLMLLNTSSYVHSSYSDKSGKDVMFFDFFSFCQDAMKAQKLMDDLVDLEVEKIDKILEKIDNDSQPDNIKKIEKDLWCKVKKTCVNGRRTGLGVTGIGDTIAKLGHVYGDERSIKVVDEIYRMLCLGSYAGSIMLAKERGSFPVYDSDKDLDCIFTKIVLQELEEYDGIFPTEIWGNVDLSEVYEKYGRRNIANLTTAPCGSVSLLTQTTSGIEPAFRLSYTRRRRVYGDEPYDFVDDLGDKWEHYTVYHKGIEEWKELNPEKDIEESVYYHSTSDKIDWISRVKLQGAAQKWIDHAISSTCNLPNDVTKETVSEIYMKAWKEGCKGFTIYRDGCRTGVLVTNNSKKEEKPKFTIHEAPNRTEVLSCDIHRARVKKQDYTILIGLYEGKPYEVFAGMSENIEIPDKYKKGKIEKIARKTMPSRYDLQIGENGDGVKIKDIAETFKNPDYSTACRLLSCSLRHGTPPKYITEQLKKDSNESMDSFNKVVARVLKKYIKEGDKSGDRCPECKEKAMIYQEGCCLCLSCGYTACS